MTITLARSRRSARARVSSRDQTHLLYNPYVPAAPYTNAWSAPEITDALGIAFFAFCIVELARVDECGFSRSLALIRRTSSTTPFNSIAR